MINLYQYYKFLFKNRYFQNLNHTFIIEFIKIYYFLFETPYINNI